MAFHPGHHFHLGRGSVATLAQQSQLESILVERFKHSHWTIIPWLKEHPDSPLMKHLKTGAHSQGLDKELDERLAQ